ncbi:division/cell wall cluster transcriptional repressor MraZ [Maridesulfovibrio zosterae]|uniref:division/cell wall cluster transcriptional repressor MraZ n=1 Tax=Maridesulfovibrio zosterae TaxID=82171 RepID=UPI0004125943|nr:division/cell wall cluster transcriptional repressor MraZ [Maridesulfovibrio zosterae]
MKFRGHAHRSMDAKGRLMLTPEYRDQVYSDSPKGCVTLTIFEGNIVGFTPPDWAILEEKLTSIKSPSRKLRNFIRIIISGSEEVYLDKQGRITIPSHLRKSGKLDKDVVLAGVGDRFEVWDKRAYEALLEQDFDDVSEELAECGVELPF